MSVSFNWPFKSGPHINHPYLLLNCTEQGTFCWTSFWTSACRRAARVTTTWRWCVFQTRRWTIRRTIRRRQSAYWFESRLLRRPTSCSNSSTVTRSRRRAGRWVQAALCLLYVSQKALRCRLWEQLHFSWSAKIAKCLTRVCSLSLWHLT